MSRIDREAWLASPQCVETLERAARWILRKAQRIGLPDGLLPCGRLEELTGSEWEECIRMTAHDLWLYLKGIPESRWERADLRWTADQGDSFLVHRIGAEYLRHLKDQARTCGVHPMRALYRRVRQVLSEEASIDYRAAKSGAFYSLVPGSPDLPDTHRLRSVPYEEWASPLEVVPASRLNRRESLVLLAKRFWEEAQRRLQSGPCALPVRELVYYLGRHYGHLSLPTRLEPRPGADGPGEDELQRVADPAAHRGPETAYVWSRLEELARRLVASWPAKERRAFALIQGDQVTLEEAAREMGYKGPSGVSYVHRSALTRLRDFCLLWPGLSPPDLDTDLFEAFVDRVVSFCKEDGRGRDE